MLRLFECRRRGHSVVVAGAVIRMVEAPAEFVAAILVRGALRLVPVILEPELGIEIASVCD